MKVVGVPHPRCALKVPQYIIIRGVVWGGCEGGEWRGREGREMEGR